MLRVSVTQARRLFSAGTCGGVGITERCAARLQTLAKQRNKPVALRVTVDSGGCAGFQYVFAVEDTASRNSAYTVEETSTDQANGCSQTRESADLVFSDHGAQVYVDPVSYSFIKGAQIDYVEELISSSFRVVDNPNSESSCGCGTSFIAKS